MRPQKLIAPWRAVSANNVYLTFCPAQLRVEIVKQIENSRIISQNCSGAVIAQILIELRERLGDVSVSAAVNNIETLSRMCVKKPQPILWHRCNRRHRCARDGWSQKS
jgi:hypothetical protein